MNRLSKRKLAADIPRIALEILAGLMFLIVPRYISDLLWIISAIFFIAIGVYEAVLFLIVASRDKKLGDNNLIVFVIAITMIVLGLVQLRYNSLFVALTSITFGLFFIIEGVVEFLSCVKNPKMKKPLKWLTLIAAVISFVLGVIIIISPFGGVVTVIRLIGCALIVSGAERLISDIKSE